MKKLKIDSLSVSSFVTETEVKDIRGGYTGFPVCFTSPRGCESIDIPCDPGPVYN